MKKAAVAALVVLLAGAVGAAGWYYYNDGSFLPAQESSGAVYVTSVSTIMGKISGAENRFAGVVEPQETVSVQKDVDRKVKEVKVKVGDEVKAGQLLFEYDLSSIEEKLAQSRLDLEQLQNEALSYQNQIATYQAEREKKENANRQLELLIDIQNAELNLKKNEYDQKAKSAEIIKLEGQTGDTQVLSEIDGIIQKIDTGKLSSTDETQAVTDDLEKDSSTYSSDTDSSDGAFITILSTGEYRVKGTVNELNRDEIIPGEGAIIRSRADETLVWRGTMGSVDSQNSKNQSSDYQSSGDSMTSSSSYPFYVELEDSEGLMLGQHVYIERDVGQEEQKSGLWLSEDFIVGTDTEDPFVWSIDENNKLIKKSVKLGEYDAYELKYEILDGLTEDDYIAFPSASLEEGMAARPGTLDQTMTWELENMENTEGEDYGEEGEYGEEIYDDSGYYTDDFDVDAVEVYDDTGEENFEMPEGEDIYVIEDDGTEYVDDAGVEYIDDPNAEYYDDAGMEYIDDADMEYTDDAGVEYIDDADVEYFDDAEVEVIDESGAEAVDETQ